MKHRSFVIKLDASKCEQKVNAIFLQRLECMSSAHWKEINICARKAQARFLQTWGE